MPSNSENAASLLTTMDYSIVQQCMHCGLCLPTCPTYNATGRERSGPRGRIALMRAVADGELPLSRDLAEELDYCVGCLACQTACPAGVQYASLLEAGRASCEDAGLLDTRMRRFYRWASMRVLMTRPWLLRLVARGVAIQQKPAIRKALYKLGLMYFAPPTLRKLEPTAPPIDPPFSDARIAPIEAPPAAWWGGGPRARVAVLTGCVQDIAYARVNRATVDVLLAAGCEVVTPRDQNCCGSLHAHNGDLEAARDMARRTLDAFSRPPYRLEALDAVISNAGGCGGHLRHYGHLLAGEPEYAERAKQWDAKLRDAHEFVWELVGSGEMAGGRGQGAGEETEPVSRLEKVLRLDSSSPTGGGARGGGEPAQTPTPKPRLTYDASCHLCHGQKVVNQPVELLKRLPGYEFVPLAESDWCCGAAGVYAITQPEQSDRLLDRKMTHVKAAAPAVIATGNPGCQHQLTMACRSDEATRDVRVVHPMELLAEACHAADGFV